MIITSVAAMKSFLQNSHQGSYVLELVYVHDTDDLYNYENPCGRSHWLLLADMLACMPNLRFLCVDVRDSPEDDEDEDEDEDGSAASGLGDEEEEEEDSGSDSSMASAIECEELEDVERKGTNVPSARVDTRKTAAEEPEPEDSQEDLEEDKRRGEDIEVDFTGIRVALRAIGTS